MTYELQPLRLQSGWKIDFNNFTEYDISIHGEMDFFELSEDLLRLSNDKFNMIIDLGWYPSYDIEGKYTLELIKNCNWDYPLEKVCTQSKSEIISNIEKWVCYDFFSKYLDK